MNEPTEYEFDEQRPDEKVVLMKHRHPWILAKAGWVIVVTASIILISFLIWGASLISSAVLVAGLIFGVLFSLLQWLIYTNDFFILTNERIINIEQRGFFSRKVSETELKDILNVSYEINGIVKSLLNFGEVNVDSSGSDSHILILKNVENPHFIQEKIVDSKKKAANQN